VTYLAVASTSQSTLTSFNDVVVFGTITTTSGGGAHGSGGGGGACFSGIVKIRVPGGVARLEELEPVCVIETRFGPRIADLVVRDYCGEMRDMGNRELVTPDHLIEANGGCWVPASLRWQRVACFEGKVYTLSVRTEIDEAALYSGRRHCGTQHQSAAAVGTIMKITQQAKITLPNGDTAIHTAELLSIVHTADGAIAAIASCCGKVGAVTTCQKCSGRGCACCSGTSSIHELYKG